MEIITSIIVSVFGKLALTQAKKHGLMLKSTYIRESLEALKHDDLETAISKYKTMMKWRKASDKTEVNREIIENAIDIRMAKTKLKLKKIRKVIKPFFLSFRIWRALYLRLFKKEIYQQLTKEEKENKELLQVLQQMKSEVGTMVTNN